MDKDKIELTTDKDKILVSVLVPVYNVEHLLRKCLDSLVSQTLKNIEIICVNDGSTDGSLAVLEEYAKKDSRIVVINQKNAGLPSARNIGLDNAKGEYVGFVDSDDYVSPKMFETLYQTALENNSDIVVCGANIFPQNPAPTYWHKYVLTTRNKNYKKFSKKILFEERGMRAFLWRNFIRRSLIEKHNLRLAKDIVLGEDQAFQFKIFPRAKVITFIKDKLYYYRWWRKGSIMSDTRTIFEKTAAHIKMIDNITDFWLDSGDMDDMANEFVSWAVNLIFADVISCSLEKRIELCKTLVGIINKVGNQRLNRLDLRTEKRIAYFDYMSTQRTRKPLLSIILEVDGKQKKMKECLSSILACKDIAIEIVFMYNYVSRRTYDVMEKLVCNDYRFSLCELVENTKVERYNLIGQCASGEYVISFKLNDYKENIDKLELFVNAARESKVSNKDTLDKDKDNYKATDSLDNGKNKAKDSLDKDNDTLNNASLDFEQAVNNIGGFDKLGDINYDKQILASAEDESSASVKTKSTAKTALNYYNKYGLKRTLKKMFSVLKR